MGKMIEPNSTRQEPTAFSEAKVETSSVDSKPIAILVVDDNVLNAELVTDLLQAQGFHVQSTETAEAAIIIARAIMPSLILMDINLPGMDGISATKILKANPVTRHLIIIGLTAETDGMANAGFDGYLSKPINIRSFVDSIKSFLPKKRNT